MTEPMSISLLFVIAIFVYHDVYVRSLQIIPERLDLAYCNESHLIECSASMVRFGRRSPYFFNVVGRTLQTWTNNVSMHVLFCEYLSNEYRRSFIDIKYKFCDSLHDDPFVGSMIAGTGMTCPLLPGCQRLINLTFPTDNFPGVFPFKRGRLDVRISTTVGNITIAIGYLFATFKDKEVKRSPQPNKKTLN